MIQFAYFWVILDRFHTSYLERMKFMQKQMMVWSASRGAAWLVLAVAVFAAIGVGQTVADVDAVVQKAVDAKAVPAAGIAVVKDGKVLLAKGYGLADVEAGTKADE